MLIIILIVLGWFLCGALGSFLMLYLYHVKGLDVTIGDIKFGLGMSLLGIANLIVAILTAFEYLITTSFGNDNKVIIKGKNVQ